MNKTIYAILVSEINIKPFVLPDGCNTFEEAEIMMNHRAEEWLDERISQEAEMELEPGNYDIDTADGETEVSLLLGGDKHEVQINFTIVPIVVPDSVDAKSQ